MSFAHVALRVAHPSGTVIAYGWNQDAGFAAVLGLGSVVNAARASIAAAG